ncbi:sensor histidine kinase [Ramlibacter sp.]|uniref:sensor histidine kinase n=1 Tax=Ramlibacter sp. TaxID=1917967 RepID=UPI002CFA0224|nr:ATP-binding protein [Ramlibacter sp.]HWI83812.1 ATP-binding protein [Ramlibacter sp.]
MSARTAPTPPTLPAPSSALVGLAYLAAFVLLDWASYIRPLQGLNITPWSPQPALAVALLMRNRRWAWIVWLGLVAAELLVRGVPDNWLGAGAATIALTLTYLAMARLLASRIGPGAPFRERGDLLWFTAVVAAGSLVCALLYILAFSVSGSAWDVAGAVTRYWVGDAVGLIVTLPVLLVAIDRARRPALAATVRSVEWWATAALTCIALMVVFSRAEQNYFKYFYLLLLPVVWASARFGLNGAVLSSAFTQVGLIVASQLALLHDLTLFELQTLMAAATLTALLLGILVDERARAAAELRSSLRLAAAGQMAAALAHELSQPLTALSNYAHAARVLGSTGGPLDAARREQLAKAVDSVASEAQRAGDVVKRLRDFFRTGATSLRRVNLEATLHEAVQAHEEYAHRLGVAIESDVPSALPAVLIDPVQIAVVLRNLLANAIESASGAPRRQVRLRAGADEGGLLVAIEDSGPGVPAGHLQNLFDAAPSTKAGGMGIGLSICRAIVEAHGGKLWAEPGPGGRFFFRLPIEDHVARTADPAS